MTVTIKDIARKAGVSYATVSRALNNRPEVSEKTRREIQRLAAEMGYKPNAIARGLVTRETLTLGLVIPDITNPFFPEVARGVEEAASEAGYSVFLCNTNWDVDKERTYIELLEEKRVDGLILASVTEDEGYLAELLSRKTPVVLINRILDQVDTNYVAIDNVKGAQQAVEHLISLGHRRIAYVGGLEHVESTTERLHGYRLALAINNIPFEEELVRYGSFKKESGYENALSLLSLPEPPTAIFAANDILALGVIQAIKERGLKVPENVAVVGFDDIPFAAYAEVNLTTVAQPKYTMGEMAAKILIDEIRKGPSPEKKHIVLPPTLVIRASSGGRREGPKNSKH
ncbi:LacI family transcriptional regulator [Desulfofundulus sp. TPOSR]|uniref:Transcriptional regulator, LacI family n=1 Tax=Desulfofundulus kuznetsovii (strain DSM 6115 / VKM B-1805 / 17) TaxID=760568 RepID=A0AAU8PHT0_DESK7|nr:LacI family DNA-binding transcriptional regulator [Desulfofundulus sp. TPOSR]AEG15214.1 transcriptional regulator, LacI family [Desulfofundulus kuznetsovii DSM 6115]NHM28342.1 LacI family transcriptional regulator [Desulfofundulus sp. TPOSR]